MKNIHAYKYIISCFIYFLYFIDVPEDSEVAAAAAEDAPLSASEGD